MNVTGNSFFSRSQRRCRSAFSDSETTPVVALNPYVVAGKVKGNYASKILI
jgi:hypothetical protein